MSTTLDERERRASEDALGAPAEIRGLVDAFSPDRLHGWAWNATRPEERVKVELRLGDAVVACTVADFARRQAWFRCPQFYLSRPVAGVIRDGILATDHGKSPPAK